MLKVDTSASVAIHKFAYQQAGFSVSDHTNFFSNKKIISEYIYMKYS
jgi:4-hydroxy-L-threonine phosphate dehydrogenase PdxA